MHGKIYCKISGNEIDFAGRLQHCGSNMQGQCMKVQSSNRVKTGQCWVRQQKEAF